MRGLERIQLRRDRTPPWAELEQIARIYRRSRKKGPDYHVDHIVPLVSPRVCGLHCEANLRIVHRLVNIAKANHYWPDMWHEQLPLQLDNMMVFQRELPLYVQPSVKRRDAMLHAASVAQANRAV